MPDAFDKRFWEQHWQQGQAAGPGSMADNPPNPYLDREAGALLPGTALDAGCGAGAETIWLASHGWRVTAVDISATALAAADERAAASGVGEHIKWVEADLRSWSPDAPFDLVMTHYAHSAMPQLEFYDRISRWVAPGGTLLIVGHLPVAGPAEHGHHRPAEACASAAAVVACLGSTQWDIVTAEEPRRTLPGHGGRAVQLHDVVVRAVRRS